MFFNIKFQSLKWVPAGYLQGTCRVPTGYLQGTYRVPTGYLLGTYWVPTGYLLGTYWVPTGYLQGMSGKNWVLTTYILGIYEVPTGYLQGTYGVPTGYLPGACQLFNSQTCLLSLPLPHRYRKAKNRLLKCCYVPATSTAQNRLLFYFFAAAFYSTMKQTRQALSNL